MKRVTFHVEEEIAWDWVRQSARNRALGQGRQQLMLVFSFVAAAPLYSAGLRNVAGAKVLA